MATERVTVLVGSAGRAIAVAGLVVLMLGGLTPAAWAATLQVDPTSGPAGAAIAVSGNGFGTICQIDSSFQDAAGTVDERGNRET